MTTYTITREGSAKAEASFDTYDANDALNQFANKLEALDVPAFYHQTDDGTPFILVAGERYFATQTEDAARALIALYGKFNADFMATVLSAGWMTDAERACFAPLVDELQRQGGKR